MQVTSPRVIGVIGHDLTHRQYEFEVFVCQAKKGPSRPDPGRAWVTLAGLSGYPLPRPQVRIAEMLKHMTGNKVR